MVDKRLLIFHNLSFSDSVSAKRISPTSNAPNTFKQFSNSFSIFSSKETNKCASTSSSTGTLVSPKNSKTASIALDRKSTRLNSSHVAISYPVFCLKKKLHHHLP